jgi:hypothetical protein
MCSVARRVRGGCTSTAGSDITRLLQANFTQQHNIGYSEKSCTGASPLQLRRQAIKLCQTTICRRTGSPHFFVAMLPLVVYLHVALRDSGRGVEQLFACTWHCTHLDQVCGAAAHSQLPST